MTWGFIWLMFVLKIPILMLFGIVWWAVRKNGEPSPPEMARVTPSPEPSHPHRPVRPRRRPRPRGPQHGAPGQLSSPPRVRAAWQTAARGRPLRDL
jgi:hypothetical protein